MHRLWFCFGDALLFHSHVSWLCAICNRVHPASASVRTVESKVGINKERSSSIS